MAEEIVEEAECELAKAAAEWQSSAWGGWDDEIEEEEEDVEAAMQELQEELEEETLALQSRAAIANRVVAADAALNSQEK